MKKILHMVFILLLLSLIVFSFIRLIPGDPVKSSLGPLASEDTIAQYRHQLYFDRPLLVQWFHWLTGVVTRGDFGTSLYTHRAVSLDIAQYLPKSLELCALAALLILVLGVFFGTLAALFKNTWVDNLIRFITYLGVVTPAYAFGIVFLLIFAYGKGAFPIGGFPTIPAEFVRTGAPALDCLLSGQFALFVKCMQSYFLPCISVAIGSIAYQARIHRSSMVENVNADYIAFAEVAGVSKGKLICKHLMKPSFIPTLTVYGLQVASLLGNAFIIENIFRINGFSQYALNVILNKDPYGIIAVTIIFGIIFSVVNMLVDIGVAMLDPRIRLRGGQ
ncbi:MAG: ABC transporter permease [Oscillospiraceae bacterium]|nr:ABC transporter permease [Oscillospiraceae bacterium]